MEMPEVLKFLHEVSDQVNSTLDLDELMVRIAQLVKRVIDYEIFSILLLNEKTQELRIRFSVGHPPEVARNLRIKVGEGIVGRAAQTRQSVLVNDVSRDPSYIPALRGVRSELAVPLVFKNRVVGVLDLEAPGTDFFAEQHRYLLDVLAGRVAMAVENARLFRRVVRQARTLELLNEISREVSSVLVLDELLRKIGALVRRLIDYHYFGILLADEQARAYQAVISIKRDDQMPDKLSVPFGQGLVGAAGQSRQIVQVADVSRDPRYLCFHPETRSEMTVPLVYHDRVIGVVDLESAHLNYFTDQHARLMSILAPQIAIAIENARLYERVVRSEARLERDLERAREIQRNMMPRTQPSIPGLELCVRQQSARELGGDLYDFVSYTRERHLLSIGDVSGKGAPAALYGAMVIGILRSMALHKLPVAEIFPRLNATLLDRKVEGHFVTLTCAMWESKAKTLRLVNGGMPLPLLLRRGECRPVRVEGVPLGLLEGTSWQETALQLEPKDLLLICSDGITEATNPAHEEFGSRRLGSLLQQHGHLPLGEMMELIFDEVSRFEGGQPRHDDQTVILIRVR
jgi:sigma-B regulation protein RsbU (phosphoserine phosphatase)